MRGVSNRGRVIAGRDCHDAFGAPALIQREQRIQGATDFEGMGLVEVFQA